MSKHINVVWIDDDFGQSGTMARTLDFFERALMTTAYRQGYDCDDIVKIGGTDDALAYFDSPRLGVDIIILDIAMPLPKDNAYCGDVTSTGCYIARHIATILYGVAKDKRKKGPLITALTQITDAEIWAQLHDTHRLYFDKDMYIYRKQDDRYVWAAEIMKRIKER